MTEGNQVMEEEHNGKRKDRREDSKFVVNEVVQRGIMDGNKYLAFLDIEKADDRVDRGMLCSVKGIWN